MLTQKYQQKHSGHMKILFNMDSSGETNSTLAYIPQRAFDSYKLNSY
jgi:hypothetical protein